MTGRYEDEEGLKSYDELEAIGRRTNSNLLLWRTFVSQIGNHFYDRNWIKVIQLVAKQPPSKFNRIAATGCAFFEGTAALNLARQTRDPKWRRVGEDAMKQLEKWTKTSKWNFESKFHILQAELHYLNKDLESAKLAYKAAIVSAGEHKFVNEEALAHELFGIFLVENGMAERGMEQFKLAHAKYIQWGALKKAEKLMEFMGIVSPSSLRGIGIRI